MHNGDTVGTLNDLCWILSGGQEDSSNDVRRVGVESTHSTSHCRSDKVLGNVHLYQIFDLALED